MSDVRFAVIGLGFFGEKHCETLSDMHGVKLQAVCTRRAGRLEEIGERFGAPERFTDYADLLAAADVDAVSIVTHVNEHKDIAVAALEAGKHVFLEKPMAGGVADCEAIMCAAREAPGKFMVGHICRFDPRVSLARRAIAEGRVGRIVSMHARRNLPAAIGAEVLDKISPLMGDGIHDADVMLWFAGEPVTSVYARTVRVNQFRYPDIGWAALNFQSGAVGVIETVWALPQNTPFTVDARMEVIGCDGAMYIDCGDAGLTVQDKHGISKPDTGYWPEVAGSLVGALRNELRYFADCVRDNRTPDVITPEESVAAVRVMCAAEESAASGRVVALT